MQNDDTSKNPAAVALGRLGGRIKSEAKRRACIANGKRGGRPKRKTDNNSPRIFLVAGVAPGAGAEQRPTEGVKDVG
jgi:hypothetical protein